MATKGSDGPAAVVFGSIARTDEADISAAATHSTAAAQTLKLRYDMLICMDIPAPIEQIQ
jgi:hypothetical protein